MYTERIPFNESLSFEFSLKCILLWQVVEELESKMRDLEMKKGKEIRVYEDKLRYQEERHKEALSLLHLECEKKVSGFFFHSFVQVE